jgi:molecular chaperone GrpE
VESETKERWISRFRAYLDTLDDEPLETPENERQIDLFSLFTELAALKNEVKLESRQLKGAVDDFKAVFATLQASHTQLQQELERSRANQQALRRVLLRPLLLELLELRDRLEAGLTALQTYRPSFFAGLCKREKLLINAVREGQEISLRRLEQLLSGHGVAAVEVLGKRLDPHTMRVAEVEHRNNLENGVVTEELRKGFNWDDEPLRTAEVKVNKYPA